MADEVSLKVLIAGRTYPLTVPKEEEEGVLKVAKMINDKMKELGKNYSVNDKQDLLAMSALNLLSQEKNTPRKAPKQEIDLIDQLDLFVSDYLQKESK